MSKTIFFDGQKSVDIFNNPDAWNILSGDNDPKGIGKLYQTVAYLYRCVTLRSNAVAAMPFTLLQGKKTVATWTGQDFEDEIPPKMLWLNNLSELMAKTEAASCLVGGAYWERRKNIIGTRDLKYDWLLPSTIHEIYNGIPGIGGMKHDPALPIGELLGFWRLEPYYGRRENAAGVARELAIDDMVYFWLPDYATEIGRAINTPGRAVLQNSNVLYGMDAFLYGYFQRGLIKASFLRYKDMISQDEAKRVKEWFRRVMLGIKNAFASEVVRGDFEVVTVGEGIKDLRDNALSEEEKISIAVGMGVPVSKLNSTTATDSNRNADEVEFIEDTIIPEIGWIYQNLNEQIFNPMGMRIKANPDTLRVMQEDETQRAQAWASYVNAGMSVEMATAVLGIDIPEGIEFVENPTAQLERDMITREMGLSEEAALQQANQEAGGNVEKLLLNGVQITAALQIVEKYAEGLFPRENAIQMYNAFLGIDPSIGQRLIPTDVPEKKPQPIQPMQPSPFEEEDQLTQRAITLLDKRDERKQFERWLKNREGDIDIDEFKTLYLSPSEKQSIFDEWLAAAEIDSLVERFADAMGNIENV